VQTQISPAKAKAAKKLFSQKCVKCHGSDGTGQTIFGQIAGATDHRLARNVLKELGELFNALLRFGI